MRGRPDATSAWSSETKNGELLPQSEVLREEARAGQKAGHERRGDRGEQSYHGCTLAQLRERVMLPSRWRAWGGASRRGTAAASRDSVPTC